MPERALEEYVKKAFGLDPARLGQAVLRRACEKARLSAGCESGLELARRLEQDPCLRESLHHELTVPETWFFRDTEPFKLLAREALAMRSARPGKRLRLLSAPCASGEEPYSMAMSLLEAGLGGDDFEVLGLDVNQAVLEAARLGLYGSNSFRGESLPDPRFFAPCPEGAEVRTQVRELVEFKRLDVLSAEFTELERGFDFIFCRNLLIYLAPSARHKLCAGLAKLIEPWGRIFVGHAELAFMSRAGFHPLDAPGAFACALSPASPPRRAMPPRLANPAPLKTGRELNPGQGVKPKFSAPRPAALAGPLSWLDEARGLADRGCLSQAGEICRKELDVSPDNAEGWVLLGLIESGQGQDKSAAECLRRAIYLAPSDKRALNLAALVHERLGETDKAGLYRRRLALADKEERHA